VQLVVMGFATISVGDASKEESSARWLVLTDQRRGAAAERAADRRIGLSDVNSGRMEAGVLAPRKHPPRAGIDRIAGRGGGGRERPGYTP
jgi:hypothetical protein